MRNFLNKLQRENIIMLACLLGYTQEVVLGKWQLDSTSKKRLRTAATNIQNFIDEVFKNLDRQQLERILKDVKASEIFVKPKTFAKIDAELEKEKLANEQVSVSRGTIEFIAEMALGNCDPCRVKDCGQCELRQAFIELNIPPLEEEDRHEDCPYKIKNVARINLKCKVI